MTASCSANSLGFACRVSNIPFVQALTTNDGLEVTAVAPLMPSSPLVTTGIVQALLAFGGCEQDSANHWRSDNL